MDQSNNFIIILAAGKGKRAYFDKKLCIEDKHAKEEPAKEEHTKSDNVFNSSQAKQAKQWRLFGKYPLVFYAIKAAQECKLIKKIYIVISNDDKEIYHDLIAKYFATTVVATTVAATTKIQLPIIGGKTRANSVHNALNFIENDLSGQASQESNILIHDGARCFITAEYLQELIQDFVDLKNRSELKDTYDETCDHKKNHKKNHNISGCIPALKITNSIKRADDNGIIIQDIKRENLYEVQTPQIFSTQDIIRAYNKEALQNKNAPDCSFMATRAGLKCKIIDGLQGNIKITTSEDFYKTPPKI